jgi:predicted phage terminase large subunit-like protein
MALAAREIMAQATFLPPRHGKSEFRSKYFPAWYLCNFPNDRILLASYSSDFAAEWGAKVRDIIEEWGEELYGIKVRSDRRAADSWQIDGHEGGMQTAGMDGPMTGKGANLLCIDDPIKTPSEAMSPTIRRKQRDWYIAAADSRMEPGGIKMLTMTPWHPEDIGGYILEHERTLWDVLRLPALAEEYDPSLPPNFGVGYDSFANMPDPLGRKPGQALWPERYSAAELAVKRDKGAEGRFWFEALYQCRPKPRDSGMFLEEWFTGNMVGSAPARARRCRHWDKAGTAGAGDWTAGVKVSVLDGIYYVEDVVRGQWSENARRRVQLETAEQDGILCWVSGEQEPGSAGKDAAASEVKMFAGYHVTITPSTGSKEVRAQPLADQCEAGNVKIVRGPWNQAFVRELCDFPMGKFDDQVDGASGAFNRLATKRAACGPVAGGESRIPSNFPSQF